MRFRERPKEIEAVRWSGSNWHEVLAFAEEMVGRGRVSTDGTDLFIHNPGEQPRLVQKDFWVVYAPDEFLGLGTVSNDVLEDRYVQVEETS